MSSKVLPPDDPQATAPVVWRQVRARGKALAEGQDWEAYRTQLEQQCEQRAMEARAAGVEEGEAAGRDRAAAELQPVIERLARAIDELGQMRARLRKEAEADLVRLSLAIARRVLRRELGVDPDALRGLVLAALEKLQSQEICRARVHPSHAALVSGCLQQNVTDHSVEVIADPSCEVGAVVFETERGNLDASVESQLQEIERGLADRLRRRS